LLNRLKKKIEKAKGEWSELLDDTLWVYQTIHKIFTCEKPFLLTYGTKAMIQAEIGYPSYRVLYFSTSTNDQGLRSNLDFLEEFRINAAMKNEVFQSRAT
jgi:hypothetical protein